MNDVITVDGVEYIRKDSMDNSVTTDTQKPIIERVKSYEDACEVLGLNPKDLQVQVSGFGTDARAIIAHSRLIVIARALNERWTPDWSDSNEPKYYPYFEHNKNAGFGFSYTFYDFWYSVTCVGSRLCFKTSELAEYAGKQFIDLYNELLN